MAQATRKQNQVTIANGDENHSFTPNTIMKANLDPEYRAALLKTIEENEDIYIKEADEAIDRFLEERKLK